MMANPPVLLPSEPQIYARTVTRGGAQANPTDRCRQAPPPPAAAVFAGVGIAAPPGAAPACPTPASCHCEGQPGSEDGEAAPGGGSSAGPLQSPGAWRAAAAAAGYKPTLTGRQVHAPLLLYPDHPGRPHVLTAAARSRCASSLLSFRLWRLPDGPLTGQLGHPGQTRLACLGSVQPTDAACVYVAACR